MKTPEQQAQEYYSKIDVLLASRETPKSLITTIFLAGHAAGKQDERERISLELAARYPLLEYEYWLTIFSTGGEKV